MTRIISLLVVLLLCLVCTKYEDNNPYDKEYEGNYFLEIEWDSIPVLLGCFITYRVPYAHSSGNDSLKLFSPVDTLGAIIDSSLFNIYPSSHFDLYFTKEYSGRIAIQGEALNGKIAGDSTSVVIADPFNISTGSTIEFGKEMSCSLAVDSQFVTFFVKDSADSVIWENNDGIKDTIAVTKPFTFRVENYDCCMVTAWFLDRRGNKGKAVTQTYTVAQIAPVVMFGDTADTIKHRVGTVPIPVSFSDANDAVDSIFCLFQDSLRRDIVKYPDRDTLILETDNIEIIDSVYIWVKDSSGLSSNKQAKVLKTTKPDTQPPYVRKCSPGEDTIITAHDSLDITLLAWDNYGVTEAACSTENSVFQGDLDTTINDSTFWQVRVTGYSFQDYYKVTPYAEDSFYISANGSPFYIYYDSTLIDSTPPEITIIFPSENSRDSTGSGTVQVKVKDIVPGKDFVDDGIDTVYYLVNGSYAGPAVEQNDSLYSFSYTLPIFHWNTIAVIAQDSSSNKNIDTAILHIDYNTVPDSFSLLQPQNNTSGLDSTVILRWSRAEDKDGDLVYYTLYYWKDSTQIDSLTIVDTLNTIYGLSGNTTYYWRVKATTELDTLYSPSKTTSFKFSVKNYPSVISNFGYSGGKTVNDVITFIVSASDPEGIKEYRWDFTADGNYDTTTTAGSVGHAYIKDSTYYTLRVAVVDNYDDIVTKDTTITITDSIPKIDADTTVDGIKYVGYKDSICLKPSATDDGIIVKYEWSIGGNPFTVMSKTDTTFWVEKENLPKIIECFFQVTDEDSNVAVDTVRVNINLLWNKISGMSWIEGREEFAVISDTNELFVLGGEKSAALQKDIWHSSSGTLWQKLSEDSSFFQRSGHAATIIGDTMYVVGGGLNGNIWRSINRGVTWGFHSNLIDLDNLYQNKLYGSQLVSVDGKIFLIGGLYGNDNTKISNKVYSFDGSVWDTLNTTINNRFPQSYNFSTFVKNDSIFLLSKDIIWSSNKDYVTMFGDLWIVEDTISIDTTEYNELLFKQDAAIIISDSTFWLRSDVSGDWQKISSLHPWSGSSYFRAVYFKEKIWIFTDKGIWYSTDTP